LIISVIRSGRGWRGGRKMINLVLSTFSESLLARNHKWINAKEPNEDLFGS